MKMNKFHTQDFITGCCAYINEYVKGANKKGVVIGLSSGVDSTLVAALSKRETNVFGLIMPIAVDTPHPNQNSIDLAIKVAKWLDIPYDVMDLTTMHKELVESMQRLHHHPETLTQANIAARVRMTALMAVGEHMNYLNIGTGNKSELSIGYITKYGDGGVDFEPLGDIYKTEVYKVARAITGFPEEVLNQAPSADLWEGQTDEGEIGMSYEELDAILMAIERDPFLQPGFTPVLLNRVSELVKRSEHKRKMPPVFSAWRCRSDKEIKEDS